MDVSSTSFSQIIADGRLTDGRVETVYFSERVIIFTSNIGAASMPQSEDPEEIKRHFMIVVEDHFVNTLNRPELLNRIGDNIIVFNPSRTTTSAGLFSQRSLVR